MVEVRGTGPYRGGQDVDAPDFQVLSDALDDLAGRNGVADRNGSLTVLDGPDGDRFVDLPSSATEPSSPEDGWVYFDTADDLLRWYNDGAWRDQAGRDGRGNLWQSEREWRCGDECESS